MSVIIEAPYPTLETATILPNPEFSDVQNQRQSVDVHRSMNNTKRTYVKSSERHLLTYAFRLTRGKSLELRAFIEAYYASDIRLTNHKDEIWIVKLSNNPFEFNGANRAVGVPGNEMVTITLNFEGVQQ